MNHLDHFSELKDKEPGHELTERDVEVLKTVWHQLAGFLRRRVEAAAPSSSPAVKMYDVHLQYRKSEGYGFFTCAPLHAIPMRFEFPPRVGEQLHVSDTYACGPEFAGRDYEVVAVKHHDGRATITALCRREDIVFHNTAPGGAEASE